MNNPFTDSQELAMREAYNKYCATYMSEPDSFWVWSVYPREKSIGKFMGIEVFEYGAHEASFGLDAEHAYAWSDNSQYVGAKIDSNPVIEFVEMFCRHKEAKYTGLHEVFMYCTLCGVKL